jgi:hypothetical protein
MCRPLGDFRYLTFKTYEEETKEEVEEGPTAIQKLKDIFNQVKEYED